MTRTHRSKKSIRKKHGRSFVWREKREKIGKILFFLIFFTLFGFFYPGGGYYQKIFSFEKHLFEEKKQVSVPKIRPVPVVKNPVFTPFLTARSAYIVDLDSFTPVFEKNSDLRLFPASTVKVITALTAMDLYNLDRQLKVDRVMPEGRTMGLVKGERITFENLLYGILIHSANDAAFVIADNYEKGYEEFVKKMNEKALEIGMKNSYFANPAGLDEQNQYTTAFDLALCAREMMKNKILAKMVSIKSITVSDSEFKYFHALQNVNRLLGEIAGVGGLKTGNTPNAGENLITFYKKNGSRFLIVILKSEDRFADTKNIVDWLNSNVEFIDVNSNVKTQSSKL